MTPRLQIEPGFWIASSMCILVFPLNWLMSALLAAFIHELGHIFAIYLTGSRIQQICISAFGARIDTDKMEDEAILFCTLAGPIAGIVLSLFWNCIPKIALCAMVQSAFNLLPIMPLDGGRVIAAVRRIRSR